jgi:hypothetical protein
VGVWTLVAVVFTFIVGVNVVARRELGRSP